MPKATGTIRLDLASIEHLFVDCGFSARSPERSTCAGLEQARRRVASGAARAPAHVRVEVEEPATAEAIDAALAAWPIRCRTLAEEHRQAAAAMRAAGRLALVLGLAVMVLCTVFAAAIDHFEPLPRLLNRLLQDGLIILGWVSLWRPLDLLLFDGTAELRRARVYEALAGSTVDVRR
ncbi:MAG TPA: hypothetical protein PKC43_01915 [Phycisphaerales bacterium]|nr:hypothetical protein [Phycisphaerales bacterium]HMP36182.1 hypothetical protein [Phycisphaerales bacterium]